APPTSSSRGPAVAVPLASASTTARRRRMLSCSPKPARRSTHSVAGPAPALARLVRGRAGDDVAVDLSDVVRVVPVRLPLDVGVLLPPGAVRPVARRRDVVERAVGAEVPRRV